MAVYRVMMTQAKRAQAERVAAGFYTDPDERAIMVAPLAEVLRAAARAYALGGIVVNEDERATVAPPAL